jgi:large subunit ribosomal protein L25
MENDVVLKAKKRTVTGKQVKRLRREGFLPAVIYGHHVEPVAIMLDAHETGIVLPRISQSKLITVSVEGGKDYPVLVREKQRNYIKKVYTHIDFLAVSLTEKLHADVAIELTGEAPAVKEFNATIVTGLTKIEVEAFPQDLPNRIIIDISGLNEIGDSLYVRDLVVSDKVRVITDGSEILVVATATKEEAVEEVAVVETAEVDVIEKGKKEEEEAK